MEKIEKGEKKIARLREIREVIREKVERHLEHQFGYILKDDSIKMNQMLHQAWPTMTFSDKKAYAYQNDEDAFLMTMMYKHGYGANKAIKQEIRRAWQFRFNWYFKCRSPSEIQKRCDFLLKVVLKEVEDFRKKNIKEDEIDRKIPAVV